MSQELISNPWPGESDFMQRTISRRKVIQSSATGLGLAMLSRWTRAARPIGANEKLKIAMIGVGGQGGGNLQRILSLGENVVAVCEVDGQRLQNASKSAN